MKRWKSMVATGALVLAITGGAFAESHDRDDRRDRDDRTYYAQRYDHRDDRGWYAQRDRDDRGYWTGRDRDRDRDRDHRRVDHDDYYGRR